MGLKDDDCYDACGPGSEGPLDQSEGDEQRVADALDLVLSVRFVPGQTRKGMGEAVGAAFAIADSVTKSSGRSVELRTFQKAGISSRFIAQALRDGVLKVVREDDARPPLDQPGQRAACGDETIRITIDGVDTRDNVLRFLRRVADALVGANRFFPDVDGQPRVGAYLSSAGLFSESKQVFATIHHDPTNWHRVWLMRGVDLAYKGDVPSDRPEGEPELQSVKAVRDVIAEWDREDKTPVFPGEGRS